MPAGWGATEVYWMLRPGASQLAFALLHEAVSKNPKLPGLIDKPELKDNFINSLAAIEAAIVDDADEAARELKEEILEKLKYGHTQVTRSRTQVTLRTVPTGTCEPLRLELVSSMTRHFSMH